MERVVLVIEGTVQLHQERQRLSALAAAHVLRGWEVARVKPHLPRKRPNDNKQREQLKEGNMKTRLLSQVRKANVSCRGDLCNGGEHNLSHKSSVLPSVR